MEPSYDWTDPTYRPAVVYAPAVPVGLRPREEHGRLRGRGADKAVDRLGDQAIRTLRFGHSLYEFSKLWKACGAVWKSAQPVAGAVDLAELDRLLAAELWVGAQLAAELGVLEEQPFDTDMAAERLRAQLDSRRADLEELAGQNADLYRAAGGDPVAVPDVVARALHRAETLDPHRPARDMGLLTAAVRELVRADEPSAPPDAGIPQAEDLAIDSGTVERLARARWHQQHGTAGRSWNDAAAPERRALLDEARSWLAAAEDAGLVPPSAPPSAEHVALWLDPDDGTVWAQLPTGDSGEDLVLPLVRAREEAVALEELRGGGARPVRIGWTR